MRAHLRTLVVALVSLSIMAFAGRAHARDLVAEAEETIATFKKADPDLARLIQSSAGYVVFPTVGKGGLGVGGAHGTGVLFDRTGKPLGKAKLNQLTVGAQAGGQAYSEVILLETPKALADFQRGEFALAAQVSAVALKAGASANARYEHGVAVFTAAKGGLMYEASVGGQKFGYEPFAEGK